MVITAHLITTATRSQHGELSIPRGVTGFCPCRF
jgi:hypothetical protein